MKYNLSHYKEKLNSDILKNEFIFYLKEKLLLNDKEIYLDKDRELNKEMDADADQIKIPKFEINPTPIG